MKECGAFITAECLICAVWTATDETGMDAYEESILHWAIGLSSVSMDCAKSVVVLAVKEPSIFVEAWREDQRAKLLEMLEAILAEAKLDPEKAYVQVSQRDAEMLRLLLQAVQS
jgi:hypothetical protein